MTRDDRVTLAAISWSLISPGRPATIAPSTASVATRARPLSTSISAPQSPRARRGELESGVHAETLHVRRAVLTDEFHGNDADARRASYHGAPPVRSPAPRERKSRANPLDFDRTGHQGHLTVAVDDPDRVGGCHSVDGSRNRTRGPRHRRDSKKAPGDDLRIARRRRRAERARAAPGDVAHPQCSESQNSVRQSKTTSKQ